MKGRKGRATAGVQRQYIRTPGRIENSHVADYLTYTSSKGHALIGADPVPAGGLE